MSVNLKQLGDSGLGFEGVDGGNGNILLGTFNYNVPTAGVPTLLFYTNRRVIIDNIEGRTFVAGTGGAATYSFYMAPSGTAPASGTVLHSGTFNMVGTIHTDQSLTLTTTLVPAEYAVWAVPTGTATSAVGGVSILGRYA